MPIRIQKRDVFFLNGVSSSSTALNSIGPGHFLFLCTITWDFSKSISARRHYFHPRHSAPLDLRREKNCAGICYLSNPLVKYDHMQNFSSKTANLDQFRAKKPLNFAKIYLLIFSGFLALNWSKFAVFELVKFSQKGPYKNFYVVKVGFWPAWDL